VIFTFGVLLLADPLPFRFLIVPLRWSLVGGSAAILLQIPQDWALLLSGVLVAAALLLDRQHRIRSSGR
jgi:hypothetical protein